MKALLESLQPGDKDWDLARAIDPARMPAHIAIIMDGNGRWAGQRRLPRVAGHKAVSVRFARRSKPARAWGQGPYPLRVFRGELEAPPARSRDPLAAAALLPPPGTAGSSEERHPPAGHRPPGRAAATRCGANWNPPSKRPRPTRPARQSGHQLRRPGRDRRRHQFRSWTGPARRQVSTPEVRRRADRRQPLHRVLPTRICSSAPPARCASATSCSGRSLTPNCTSPDALARLHAHATCCAPSWNTRSATGATAASATETARRRVLTPTTTDPGPSHVMKRVLTALALVPVVVYVVLFANLWIFLAVLFGVAFLCYREYDQIAAAYGFGAPGIAGAAAGYLLFAWPDNRPALALPRRRRADRLHSRDAHGRPLQSPTPRVAADRRRRVHLRRLEMRHPPARDQPALADVRPHAQLGRRHRRVFHRTQVRQTQARAPRQPQEIVGGLHRLRRHVRADRRRLPLALRPRHPDPPHRRPSRSPPISPGNSATSPSPP